MTRAALAGLLLGVLFPAPAPGHAFHPALLEITEAGPGRYDVLWKAPRPASADGTGTALLRGVEPEFPAACAVRRVAPPPEVLDPPSVRLALECPGAGLAGREVRIRSETPRAEVLIRLSRGEGRETTAVLRGTAMTFRVPPPDERSPWRTLVGYVQLGARHIAEGVDHLLFVGGLLLLVRSARAILAAVTAFTVAHSLTLALATTGAVRLSQAPVEVLVAVSIVLLAREVLGRAADAGPPPLARPWSLAFAFGLLHGFGFAGALAEVGLPAGRVPEALLGFNLGVELGQVVFVALAWPLVRLAGRAAPWLPRAAALAPPYALGVSGAGIALSRLPGLL